MPKATLSRQLEAVVQPLTGAPEDYEPLLALIGNARFVLLGEASHGTHEFYRERAQITKRLIQEKGFTAVAVEADWPDAYRVNRYGRGVSDDTESVEALANFKRFPTWMWRNADVLDFVGWLRSYNDTRASGDTPVGFMASISIACMPQTWQSWAISTKLTRKPLGGHGIATGALSTLVKTPRRMAMPPALVSVSRAKIRLSASLPNSSAAPRSMPGAMGVWRLTNFSTPNRMRVW